MLKIFWELRLTLKTIKISVFFVMEWEDSKIIDFVKREDCIEKCPKLVAKFYQTLFAEVINDWNGIISYEENQIQRIESKITWLCIKSMSRNEKYFFMLKHKYLFRRVFILNSRGSHTTELDKR